MLDVVVLGHGVCRSGDARFAETCLWLVFKCDNVRNTCSQLIRSTNLDHTADIVKFRLVVEVIEVAAFKSHTIAVIEIASLAAVAPSIVDALDVHVHLRLVAVLVPHALSRIVGRKRLLGDIAVAVVLIVGDCRAAAELLRYLCQMVRVLGVVSRRHVMIHRAVTSDNRHIRRKSKNVLVGIVRVLDVCRIVVAARTAVAEVALVTVAVRLQFTMISIEIILVPRLGYNHTLRCALILLIGSITKGNESRCTVAVNHILLCEGVAVCIGGHVVSVILVHGLGELVACCVRNV